MAKEYAEICWPEKPQAEFYDLTKKSQDRLSAFLEKQRVALERSGGGNQEGFAWEWEPGFAVYWDIKLKPQFRTAGTWLTSQTPKIRAPWFSLPGKTCVDAGQATSHCLR